MGELVDSKVKRKGASEWDDKLVDATANLTLYASTIRQDTGVQIRFSLPSKGGGYTTIVADIGAGDYYALCPGDDHEQCTRSA